MKFKVEFSEDDVDADVSLTSLLDVAFPSAAFPKQLKDYLDGLLGVPFTTWLGHSDSPAMVVDIGHAYHKLDYDSHAQLGPRATPFLKVSRSISYFATPEDRQDLPILAMQIARLPKFISPGDPDEQRYRDIETLVAEAAIRTRKLSVVQFKGWLDKLAIRPHAEYPFELLACEVKHVENDADQPAQQAISLVHQLNPEFILALDLRILL